jgi:hypothetical protein
MIYGIGSWISMKKQVTGPTVPVIHNKEDVGTVTSIHTARHLIKDFQVVILGQNFQGELLSFNLPSLLMLTNYFRASLYVTCNYS